MIDAVIALRFFAAVLSVGAILALLFVSLRALSGRAPVMRARRLRVLETVMLANGAALYIVEAGAQRLVVGSAHGAVTLLTIEEPGGGRAAKAAAFRGPRRGSA
jgi:flagellar biogenesis protein FliO